MSFVFCLLALLALASAMAVVICRKVVYSITALACHLVAMAAIYCLLHAGFVALVQLLLAAAIVFMVLAAALLSRSKVEDYEREDNLFVFSVVLVAALMLFLLLPFMIFFVSDPALSDYQFLSGAVRIGQRLFSRYVFAFLLVGILTLVTLVAVVMLGQPLKRGIVNGDQSDGT